MTTRLVPLLIQSQLPTVNKQFVNVNAKSLKTPFKDGTPGEDWCYSFMKMHPNLSLKKPEHLQMLRKDARKPEVIYQFYQDLEKVINENSLVEDKNSFVFNADESGFCCDPN